eukprot:11682280-Alexandrium_andersonii.AAC.1
MSASLVGSEMCIRDSSCSREGASDSSAFRWCPESRTSDSSALRGCSLWCALDQVSQQPDIGGIFL